MGKKLYKGLGQFMGIMLLVFLATIRCGATSAEQGQEGNITYNVNDEKDIELPLKLQMNWDNWSGVEREYDGTKEIVFQISIKNSEAVTFEGIEKEAVNVKDDAIIITGSVNSANVGNYNKLVIEDVRIEGNTYIYDISEIESLKKKEITLPARLIKITQAVIKDVKISEVELYYRTDAINISKTKNKIEIPEYVTNIKDESTESKKEDGMKEELIQLMGKVVVIPEENRCSFTGIEVKEENGSKIYYVKNDNIEFQFDNENNRMDKENQNVSQIEDEYGFNYRYESETIEDCNMADSIFLTQNIGTASSSSGENENQRIVSNQSWCNENLFSVSIKRDSIYKKSYNHILFRKLNIQNFGELQNCRISDHNNLQGTTEQLKGNVNKGEEGIYEILFSYEGEDGKDYYPTVAAFLRIIEEENVDESLRYPTIVEDKEQNKYSVINVFLDTSGAEVDFKELGGMKYTQDGELFKKYLGDKKITFQVINKGFKVKKIEYAICKVNETMSDSILIKNIQMKDNFQVMDVNSEKEYEVSLPDKDGIYVICVRVINEDKMLSQYVSNGTIVDTTSPEIIADFYCEEMEEETGKSERKQIKSITSEAQTTYIANPVTAFFQIQEANLQDVDVEVVATDRMGKEIETIQQINAQIEQLRENLLKDNKGSLTFTEDANYRIRMKASDKTGLTSEEMTYCFSIDTKVPPIGKVNITGIFQEETIQKTWNTFIKDITFKTFSQENICVTFEGADEMSPVTIYYYIADEEKTMEELEHLDKAEWKVYSVDASVEIATNRKVVIYEKVEDAAGNKSYFNSDGIITDNQNPEIEISGNKKPNENGFYSGELVFAVSVEDKTKSREYACSGLQQVSYRVEKNGIAIQSRTVYELGEKASENPSEHVKEDFQIKIQEDFHNSDAVILYVTAVDNAGNRRVYKESLKIDNVKPEITVTYDKDVVNGKYCNQERTATITIKERNLDTKDVKLSVNSKKNSKVKIGKWTHDSNAGKSDEAIYECKVTFFQDDNYKFAVSCVDQAGNKAEKNNLAAFILDTTKPVISVKYSGQAPVENSFYNEKVTATITIKEQYFNAENVQIRTSATKKTTEKEKGETKISKFFSNGDEHTATVQYDTDGRYGLDIFYIDEAENEADRFCSESFVIDLTTPEIVITNITDKSANKGDVKPVITCTDTNYNANLLNVSLTGSNNGRIDLEKAGYTISNIKNGQQIGLDFPKTEEMDDMYTLTVAMQDKAGNEKKTSIEFSVNRYGSVYTLGEETKTWLKKGECVYLKEEKPVIIIETNVNETVNHNVSYSLSGMDSSVTEIQEIGECTEEEKEKGLYYMISEMDSENGWNQRRYEINSSNFEKEGMYTIHVDSEDKAGNVMSNVSNRHSDGKLEMVFAIDKTAPSVVVSGAENGDIYNAVEHTLFLDAQDNLALDQVAVYVDEKEYGSYTTEDIENFDNGLIPITIKEAVSMQTIRVVATDKAGNIISSDKKSGENSQTFENIRILVTTNTFARYLHTPWVRIFVICIVAGMVGSVGIFVYRHR